VRGFVARELVWKKEYHPNKEGRRPRLSCDWVGWRPPDAILASPLPRNTQELGKRILFSAAGNSGHSGRITTPRPGS
jgi:hypothetical protein